MVTSTASARPIRIGISACLLGQNVRYDGGHKRDRYVTDTLGEYFEWVSVCPEVEIGLGTPRPIIRLEDHAGDIRLTMPSTGRDLTRDMNEYAKKRVRALRRLQLSGYLLKSKSPSCGMERVKVYRGRGGPSKQGRGVFATRLMEAFPDLPVEEEGRLCDPVLRENWIERVFAYHNLAGLWGSRWKIGDLVRFHTRYKFLLLAHSPKAYASLGRLVGGSKSASRRELRSRYTLAFMEGLANIATRRKHVNVLDHILGFFKRDLDKPARDELLMHIRDYGRGHVPLVVPLTLVSHYVRLLDVEYLRDQVYLNPHPKELALRTGV
jgi:uncharacterized protein YbbK (DUF523 family)/uncharacterized protein YbgA (DUF1722 family)